MVGRTVMVEEMAMAAVASVVVEPEGLVATVRAMTVLAVAAAAATVAAVYWEVGARAAGSREEVVRAAVERVAQVAA